MNIKNAEIWFLTGSQHLYGDETLKQVAAHSKSIADELDRASEIPISVKHLPTKFVKKQTEIRIVLVL